MHGAQANPYVARRWEPEDLTEEGGWAESQLGANGSGGGGGGGGGNGNGETDWAAIVGAALGGTAAIIRAAEGTPAKSPTPKAPTFDPYAAQKASAGPPMWVYLAGGALLLVVVMGQRK